MELNKSKTNILGKGAIRILDSRLCIRVLFSNKERYINFLRY